MIKSARIIAVLDTVIGSLMIMTGTTPLLGTMMLNITYIVAGVIDHFI